MSLVSHLHSLIHNYGYFAVFVTVCLECLGVPIPGETALVTAAIFAGERELDIFGVIGTPRHSRQTVTNTAK